ncbi:hypothetical protein [Terribacillus saccharophilus]|uniref:hypothetical protein n=1 Tax=Terribacillus saccharophilus TaxID=361277 RepID=UPI0015C7538B|nr:hypothetical protein [Terribacillus saccharophilus]
MAVSFEEFRKRYRQKLKGQTVSLFISNTELYKLWLAASVLEELENEKKSRR